MKPFVVYGPGYSGDYDTAEEAQAVLDKHRGNGAVYVVLEPTEATLSWLDKMLKEFRVDIFDLAHYGNIERKPPKA